ncbi:MAG TPA: hypothetical protein VIY56_04830 [Vicinamibacterales bacterium]
MRFERRLLLACGEVTTGIEYAAVRPDPDHVLPAGFVHPAIKK